MVLINIYITLYSSNNIPNNQFRNDHNLYIFVLCKSNSAVPIKSKGFEFQIDAKTMCMY